MADHKTLQEFHCAVCKKHFVHKASLKRHISQVHPHKKGYIASLAAWKTYKYVCQCGRRFNQLFNFRSHERKIHNVTAPPVYKNTRKCPLCSRTLENENPITHFQDRHNLKIEIEQLQFDNFQQFKEWKENIEKEIKCIFTKTTGSQLCGETKKYYFGCHRSGYFKPKGQGMRRLKSQGSRKIDGFCPASMLVIETKDSKCDVNFTKTHVGHTNSLRHINISNSERKYVAEKVVAKVPFDKILAEVRNNEPISAIKRVNLLNKKDLFNIKKSLNNLLGSFDDNIPNEVMEDIQPNVENCVQSFSDNENSLSQSQAPAIHPIYDNDSTAESSSLALSVEKEIMVKNISEFIYSLSTKAEVETVQQVFISLKTSLDISKENHDNLRIPDQAVNVNQSEQYQPDHPSNGIKIELMSTNTNKEKILSLSNF